MSTLVEQCNQVASAWWGWTSRATAQGVILLVLVLVLVALWRRAAPTLRYGLFLLVLAKFLVPPVVCSSLGLFAWLARSEDPAPVVSESNMVTVVQSVSQGDEFSPLPISAVAIPEVETPSYALTTASWVLAAQCLGSAAILLFILSRVHVLGNFLRASRRLESGSLHDQATALARRMGLRRVPAMYLSTQTASPHSGGFVHPFIVLPEWVETMAPSDRDILIAHELAHVRRYDGMVNWFQALVQALLWWNPAVWWVNTRIRSERELCCDDLVLAHGIAEGACYSRMLVAAAERISSRTPSLAMMGMADSFQSIDRRVRRALDPQPKRPMRMSVASAIALLAFAAWALPGASPGAVDDAPSQPRADLSEPNSSSASSEPTNAATEDGDETPARKIVYQDLRWTNSMRIQGEHRIVDGNGNFSITPCHSNPFSG